MISVRINKYPDRLWFQFCQYQLIKFTTVFKNIIFEYFSSFEIKRKNSNQFIENMLYQDAKMIIHIKYKTCQTISTTTVNEI